MEILKTTDMQRIDVRGQFIKETGKHWQEKNGRVYDGYAQWMEDKICELYELLSEVQKTNQHSEARRISKLLDKLGAPEQDNTYTIRPDAEGVWWIEHNDVGSGEPLSQFLNAGYGPLNNASTECKAEALAKIISLYESGPRLRPKPVPAKQGRMIDSQFLQTIQSEFIVDFKE